ncbi:MAG: ribonuclease H-like domain-containing protein [Bryobacteraceae bacterium]
MLDTDEQLARLKQQIALISDKFRAQSGKDKPPVAPPCPAGIHGSSGRWFIEEWSQGEVVENEFGQHFQTERLFPSHKNHGSADVGALVDLPDDFLGILGNREVRTCSPCRWAFLDTETTGLLGGSASYAFLIGVGRITREGFKVRQFFMREYAEERSILAALETHLNDFDVLITYNGKSYDQPLLETRYLTTRQKAPFARLGHLDLLHGARRLWKLRIANCRLMQLEEQILGVYRDGDLPGELIPYVYFEYLRSHEAHRLVPIFHHNAVDILTLACLTAIVPAAFRAIDSESLARVGVRRGEDLASIARWLIAAEEHEQGLELLKRAIDVGLPDPLVFRALWDTALLEKRLGRPMDALRVFSELAACRNEYRVCALEEMAKYYEHDECNYTLALDFTNQALEFQPSCALKHRRARLERRLAKPLSRRLPRNSGDQ